MLDRRFVPVPLQDDPGNTDMNPLLFWPTFWTAVLLGPAAAMAVNMQNYDDRDYEVTIRPGDDGAESSTFTLYSGGTEEDVCDACKIAIDGLGEIEAQGSETVKISGSKLAK